MHFDVLNKASSEVKAIAKKDRARAVMTIEKKSFYFTAEAVKVMHMHGEKYVHFMRGKDEHNQPNGHWYAVVNEINTGFKIVIVHVSGGARANCTPMVRLFMQSTKQKIGARFLLKKTTHTLENGSVFEVVFYKGNSETL